jgi:hypothetical protein
VRKNRNVAKFWVLPEVSLALAWGMNSRELNMLEKKVEENVDLIRRRWNENFS